jgi:two-component system CheB/CheR fusion protein
MIFVVVMHLSPEHESNLSQVLQLHTAIPVEQVRGRVCMEPDHVYVIPPNQNLEITDGHLVLSDFEAPRGRRTPIDVFFRTLAERHPDGIGILLSGGGTDGTIGMKAIKEHGGLLMAQLPEEAEYDTMPRSAIATGLVDFVLPAAELAGKLLELCQHGLPDRQRQRPEALPEGEENALDKVLTLLQARTGHDFSGYKHATVLRRIERRLRMAQVDNLSAYQGYLRGHPPEAQALLKDLLISVTTFFRDAEAFEALREQVMPKIFEGKTPGDEVRVWVPGCATGEEAYAIAMLLLEQADTLAAPPHIQLFASDLDEDALTYAREGFYPDTIVADVSEARLQRCFVRDGAYYRVRKELRDIILFAPHSLLKDPPFSRLDLISCRNLLIYLQRDLQEKVAGLFHYALKPEGYLFLGSAESLEGVTTLFRAMDKTHRLYRCEPTPAHGPVRLPNLPLSVTTPGWMTSSRPRSLSLQQAASDAKLHRQALETHAPPSLIVDADANIVHVSETANRYLRFPSGSPSPNLYKAALPELRLELRTALYRALEKNEATISAPVSAEIWGQRRLVQLYITPTTHEQAPSMALVVFAEASLPGPGSRRAEDPASGGEVDPRLRQLEEELEVVKTQLQGTIEASETQEEELKAANEELQSINEEYKSTLEELETSKEELQSINEELTTVNQELKERLQALSQANNDLHNLMAATDVGTLFIDRQLTIKLYTPALTKLFNIMPVDRGRPLAHVTHRLGNAHILRDTQQVLETLIPIVHEVQRDDGCYYLMRLTPYSTTEGRTEGVVVTFVDITPLKRVEQQARESEEQFQTTRQEAGEALRTLNTTLEQRVAELQQAHESLHHEISERQRMQESLFQQEKLAALGTLLANVAHELNNPLAVAALQLDNLQEERGPGSWMEDLKTLRQAVERCNSVVQSFLALARQQAPTRSAVALNAVIGDVLVLLRHALEADGITVHLHLAEDLPLVWADSHQLHHVVANLITNAHHALREEAAPSQHLTLTTAANAERTQVTLDVADTGPGISADHQRRVFEPFFTTKAQGVGNGLGLSLCRNVVEGHGGTIRISSQLGHGTTVSVALPVAAPDIPCPEALPEPVELEQAQRGTILLIDDEPGVQHALGRLLRRSGHDITIVATGHEGLVAIQERSYDIILCDMRMPGLDGPGFYRELERRYPHLLSRIIFLTGDVLSPKAQAFFDQVKRPRLEKPFRAQEVRRVILQMLENR